MTGHDSTFAIIKPGAVKQRGAIGDILARIGNARITVVRMQLGRLSPDDWKEFYSEHSARDFFPGLIQFMSSGPCVFLQLCSPSSTEHHGEQDAGIRDDVLTVWRRMAGATDPASAGLETIRARWGVGGPRNAVHGSDSRDSYEREIEFWGRIQ